LTYRLANAFREFVVSTVADTTNKCLEEWRNLPLKITGPQLRAIIIAVAHTATHLVKLPGSSFRLI